MISNNSRNFPSIQMIFGNFFILPFELIPRAFLFPIFEFSFRIFDDAKGQESPSTYPSWGSDNSPPLNRISSRDSEVVGRKVGYSTRRRSSLSQFASFSE